MIHLCRADLALYTDPVATRVHIPSLMAAVRVREREGVDVKFEGDDWPTPFDGEGRMGTFDLSCRYARKNRPLQVALEYLVDELAPRQFDKRLLFRTHVEPGVDLSPELQLFVARGSAVPVRIRRLVATPVGAAAVDLTFTATIVQHRARF